MHWVYSVVHSGVVSHEVDNLIWIILCGFHVGGESASRTLLTQKRSNFQTCNLPNSFFGGMTSNVICGRRGVYVMCLLFITHCARSWIGDLPSVCHPLVVGPFLVGKRPIEDHTDVSHGVDAHCRAFEDGSGGVQEKKGEHKEAAASGYRLTRSLG